MAGAVYLAMLLRHVQDVMMSSNACLWTDQSAEDTPVEYLEEIEDAKERVQSVQPAVADVARALCAPGVTSDEVEAYGRFLSDAVTAGFGGVALVGHCIERAKRDPRNVSAGWLQAIEESFIESRPEVWQDAILRWPAPFDSSAMADDVIRASTNAVTIHDSLTQLSQSSAAGLRIGRHFETPGYALEGQLFAALEALRLGGITDESPPFIDLRSALQAFAEAAARTTSILSKADISLLHEGDCLTWDAGLTLACEVVTVVNELETGLPEPRYQAVVWAEELATEVHGWLFAQINDQRYSVAMANRNIRSATGKPPRKRARNG